MIELSIQQFGGRGGSSGSSGDGIPERLKSDDYMAYYITTDSSGKRETELFFGPAWELKEREMNFAESKGLDYKQYMRQRRHSFMAVLYEDKRPYAVLHPKTAAKEIFNTKEALKGYNEHKRRVLERYKKWIKGEY